MASEPRYKRGFEAFTSDHDLDPVWLEAYCFSPRGQALRHGIQGREQYLKLTSLPVSGDLWKPKEAKPSSLDPSPQELEPANHPSTIECLQVGLVFSDIRQVTETSRSARKVKQSQDLLQSEPIKYLISKADAPYRVVMEFATQENTDGGADPKLYILVPERKGLCQPYLPNKQDEIFYFSEFVDTEKNATARSSSWHKICKKAAGYSAPPLMLKNGGDPTRFIQKPQMELSANLIMLAATWNRTKDPEILNELEAVVNRAYPDLKNKDTLSFESLWEFFDFENELMHGEELVIIAQLRAYWPDVILKPGWIVLIKRGLVESEICVDPRVQRAFLAMASLEFRRTAEHETLSTEMLGKLVQRLHLEAEFVIGDIQSGSSVVKDEVVDDVQWKSSAIKDEMGGDVKSESPATEDDRILLCFIKDTLLKVHGAGRISSENFANLSGSQALMLEGDILHPASIFKVLQHAVDADTAKLALEQLALIPFKAVAIELVQVYEKPIKQLITAIDRYLIGTGKRSLYSPVPRSKNERLIFCTIGK